LTIGINCGISVILVRSTPLAEIIVGCDCESPELAQPPRDILDVFVQPKNLHRHQDDGRVLHVGRPGKIDRHLAVGDFDLGLTDGQAGGIGLDRVGADRSRGERIAGCGGGRGRQEKAAPRQRIDLVRESLDIGHQLELRRHTESSLYMASEIRAADR
jgi:hypothetical protein